MVLDGSALASALLDAAEEGIREALEEVQHRAREKAPVRDVFRHGRGRSRVQLQSAAKLGKGRVTRAHPFGGGLGSAQRARRGLELVRAEDVNGRARRGQYRVGTGTIRGRANSMSPVLQSPAGFIGGAALRELSRPGVLKVQSIAHGGKLFSAKSLLSSRGRYELQSGRANFKSTEGLTLGGRLRAGIVVEGPFRSSGEIFGYVAASAHDPGREHNYAKDQEFGSRHNRPQPFLRPAFRESREKIKKYTHGGILKRAISNARVSGSTSAVDPIEIDVDIKFVGWDKVANQIVKELR